ncbi:aspartyl-tRNA synthetase [Auriculariales sp. MPI-PUGE-AT-0066]|nr:aspartyl-tRNA synthetase [Auriculariales sp. MPI-PUGE-AT-0066]
MAFGRVFSMRRHSKSPKSAETGRHQQHRHEKVEHKRQMTLARDAERDEQRRRHDAEEEQAAREESPEQRARYGPIDRATATMLAAPRIHITDLKEGDDGQTVVFRARIHTVRVKGHALVFVLFRQSGISIQGVVAPSNDLTEHMLRWTRRLYTESVVLVSGVLQRPPSPVAGASIHNLELNVRSVHLISAPTVHLPFDVYHADNAPRDVQIPLSPTAPAPLSPNSGTPPMSPTNDSPLRLDSIDSSQLTRPSRHGSLPTISDRTRLAHRVMDIRSASSQSIFRVQAAISRLFREYLDDRGFVELHTPKLQGGATESGASVFNVNYFGRNAFLAQSPQLAKQMAISGDLERVYEIGPVFRAENSNTHRHLTEYTGLDLEMAFEHDYHEVMDTIDGLIKHMLKGIHERHKKEIEVVRQTFPSEPLVWLEKTPVLTFSEGIQMLREAGWTDDSEDEDISTAGERLLGKLVKEKYNTDYYILDKFPVNARPFYTMPDSKDSRFTNAFDIFLRGQEILSGSQRIHDAAHLERNMRAKGVRPQAMEDYMDGFRWGAPPHAGCGFGLERIVMLLLDLGDIRHASMFPRDPKSLPAIQELAEPLRHDDANTLEPAWGRHRAEGTVDEMPALEKLIANYGDAPNTAWLDKRYSIWRHAPTGAAIGYSIVGKYVIVIGDPLCDRSQLARVSGAFLQWATKEKRLHPLWLLASEALERVLGEKHGWRTLTCVAEARVQPGQATVTDPAGAVARKLRHAEKEGVKIDDFALGEELSKELRAEVDVRIQDWLNGRKGKQVHLTDVDPWHDFAHRRFSIGRDKDGKVVGMVVLAQLSPRHGFQIKWALDFPGAPGGTIEYMVMNAIHAAQGMGAKSVTFGATPSPEFHVGHNIAGTKARVLEHAYNTLTKTLHLLNKSEFKEKLGAVQDAEYICYPPRSMGPMAIRAILQFFGANDEAPDAHKHEHKHERSHSRDKNDHNNKPERASQSQSHDVSREDGPLTPRRSIFRKSVDFTFRRTGSGSVPASAPQSGVHSRASTVEPSPVPTPAPGSVPSTPNRL